ncbi:MAG: lipoyl(octanoyl) transferase LipB [Methylococcaceae bacterium]
MMLTIRNLGLQDYDITWQAMQRFTHERTTDTNDELWIVEHPSIYTLGLNGKREHLLTIGNIPVINSDRGGQVTYHGPGQIIIYVLLDIKRLNLGIHQLVKILEQSMISVLAQHDISGLSRIDAPGVYVNDQKIGSIGLRIKKNCSYHGLSLNNNMDLRPFDHINTCGYSGLKVTQLSDLGVTVSSKELADSVTQAITAALFL